LPAAITPNIIQSSRSQTLILIVAHLSSRSPRYRWGDASDNLSFAADAAGKIGATERTVERSVRRAEKICGKARCAQCRRLASGLLPGNEVTREALLAFAEEFEAKARIRPEGKPDKVDDG